MHQKALNVGDTVKVKSAGKVVEVEVVEIAGDRFCAAFPDGDLRWISKNSIVQ